jgi:oligopeptide transport system substrate-binding protein
MLAGNDDVTIVTSPANSIRYLGFNLERQPMGDHAFRTALALLFDRAETVSEVVPGADPAFALIPPANRTWFDQGEWLELASPYDRNLKQRLREAVRGLREAGYHWEKRPKVVDGSVRAGTGLTIDGVPPAPLTILTSGDQHDPARPEYTRKIVKTLRKLGFEVRPVETDFDTVVELAFTPRSDGPRQFDMYLLGWTLGNPALPDFYEEFFIGDGAINSTGYDSDQFADVWDEYRNAENLSQALAALWEMEAILAQDLPYLPLYHPTITEAYRSDRIQYGLSGVLGGLQGRSAGIGDISPAE